MRHHHDGLAEVPVEELQDRQDLVGRGAVEVAGRLVAQQQLGVGHDRARDRDALLLPARHLARIVLHAVGEIDHLERGLDVLAPLLAVEPGQQQRQLDVLRRGQHRHQIVELEDEADIGGAKARELALRQPVDALPGDMDLAARRPVDAAEQIEQRRLARARRPHHGDEVAARDGEVEVVEDRDRLLALDEALAQAGEANHRVSDAMSSPVRCSCSRCARSVRGRGFLARGSGGASRGT